MIEAELKKSQRLLIGHGALVLLVGFVMGFGFLFFLLGEIRLWPFPWIIEYPLPGTYDAWRMAHTEGIANGFMLWIMAAVLPAMSSLIERVYRLAWGMVVVAWTIVLASCLDPLLPNARGLAFTAESSLASDIAFFLFYIGIAIVCAVVVIIALKAFKIPE